MSEVRDKPRSFFDLFSDGQVRAADIDDFIEAWHDSGDAEDRPLAAFLGMTNDEYAVWLMDGHALPALARARQAGQPLETVVAERVRQMRATGDPVYRAALFAMGHWLVARGIEAG